MAIPEEYHRIPIASFRNPIEILQKYHRNIMETP